MIQARITEVVDYLAKVLEWTGEEEGERERERERVRAIYTVIL
jgi:hypothetical protein